MMRSYPLNSPQAAARLMAIALLADGALQDEERHAIRQQQQRTQHPTLGAIDEALLEQSISELCEDLAATRPDIPQTRESALYALNIDMLQWALDEITEPALRFALLDVALSIIRADHLFHIGEKLLLQNMLQHWPSLDPHSP